jgi:hypothetical protein
VRTGGLYGHHSSDGRLSEHDGIHGIYCVVIAAVVLIATV